MVVNKIRILLFSHHNLCPDGFHFRNMSCTFSSGWTIYWFQNLRLRYCSTPQPDICPTYICWAGGLAAAGFGAGRARCQRAELGERRMECKRQWTALGLELISAICTWSCKINSREIVICRALMVTCFCAMVSGCNKPEQPQVESWKCGNSLGE